MTRKAARQALDADTSARRLAAAGAGFSGDEAGARRYLEDAEPAVRLAAFGALVHLEAAELADVNRFLADPAPDVRRGVCQLAARLTWADFSALLSDEDPAVLEAACFAVGEARDREVTRRLSDIARHHGDPLCREAAIAALGAIGDPQGEPAVLAALDDTPAIRRRAVVALAAFDGPDVERALKASLSDRDWQVRQAAADVAGVSEPERR